MDEWINEGEQANLPRRRIPNKLYRYSALKEVEHNSPILKCGLHTETSFQRVQYRKKKKEQLYSGETWQSLPQSGDQSQHEPLIRCGKNGTWPLVFLSKTQNPSLIMRKHQTNPERGASYHMPAWYSPKLLIKVIKNREGLRNITSKSQDNCEMGFWREKDIRGKLSKSE